MIAPKLLAATGLAAAALGLGACGASGLATPQQVEAQAARDFAAGQ